MSTTRSAPVLLAAKSMGLRLGAVQALSELSFSISQGESVALVGANGSGKSSLLRVLQGLVMPTEGSVYQHDLKRQALVFQRPWMMRANTDGGSAGIAAG
jgi:tungstate transport system ATP-binding protein